MRYKVTILEFNGEGEGLKAQSLYEQTVKELDIRTVVDAVNSFWVTPAAPAKRTRATRSDKGKKRVEDIVPD